MVDDHNMMLVLALLLCCALPAAVTGQAQAAKASAEKPNSPKERGGPPLIDRNAVNYGPARGCLPPTLPVKATPGALVPPLPAGERPNFIIIMTDDQGYDDMGLHQPQRPGGAPTWVNTPNIDKFLRQATEFDNFYLAPMCSQSRAALLTGRDFARTGTMLINGGYDYLNRNEITSAEYMKAAGYDTSHFGKWHNGRTLGYEPWTVGFQESWLPSSHVHLDNLMRHNGRYIQTRGLMEQDLMDKILGYLKEHESSSKPFYMFYAPHAVHQGFLRPGQGPRWQRPAPEPYRTKYRDMLPKLPSDTAEVWAFLEYMDDVLGRLFDYMDNSPLKRTTYIMLMSDNGAELFPTERRGKDKLRRMPSGMQGFKKDIKEGGIRNFLAVKGPGVPAGAVDSTLASITDVLPTMADLAGITAPPKYPWDGMSLRNLLLGSGTRRPIESLRGKQLASPQQEDRFIFAFGPQCWSPDTVPLLGPDRKVLKPQELLDYSTGGVDGLGFKRCIAIRWKHYKWLGDTGKVYKFWGNSHIELPCNEVTGPEATEVADRLSKVARNYFESLVMDVHSFRKPIFQLGLGKWAVTNILPDGAHERTPDRVQLLPNGAAGFSRVGDRACFAVNVVTGGIYKVSIIYTSQVQATFKLSVGTYAEIEEGTAPSRTAQLPISAKMRGRDIGEMRLAPSNEVNTETCIVMVSTSSPGVPVFENLSNIRFTLQRGKKAWSGETYGVEVERAEEDMSDKKKPSQNAVARAAAAAKANSNGSSRTGRPASTAISRSRTSGVRPAFDMSWVGQDSVLDTWEAVQQERLIHSNLQATAAMQQVEKEAYQAAALRLAANSAKEKMDLKRTRATPGQVAQQYWDAMRQRYLWPDGQGHVLESMFTPYESEGIYSCAQCQPEID